jgi:hypothetical protein
MLVIDGNRHRRLPSIRHDLHPISSSLTTSTGQWPRTLPAAHHHGDTRQQRRGDATSPTAERVLAASRPQPSSTPRRGDYMAGQRSHPDVPRRLPVAKHALGTVHSSNDDNDNDTPHIPFNTRYARRRTTRHDGGRRRHDTMADDDHATRRDAQRP